MVKPKRSLIICAVLVALLYLISYFQSIEIPNKGEALKDGNVNSAVGITEAENREKDYFYENFENRNVEAENSKVNCSHKNPESQSAEADGAENKKADCSLENQDTEKAVQYLSEVQEERDNIYIADRGGRAYSVNLLAKSGLTQEWIDRLVENTALAGLGQAYIDAEKETGVNALFLLAISIHESDWGASRFAVERNNIFGFQAYTHDPDAAMFFDSKEDCIMIVARYLRDNYLNPEGKYYKGPGVKDVNRCYATDPAWHVAVERYMNMLLERILVESSMKNS